MSKPGVVYLDINKELKKSRPDLVQAFQDFVNYWNSQVPDQRKSDLSGKIQLGGDEYWFNAYLSMGKFGPTIRASVGDKVQQQPSGYQPPQQGYQPPQQGYTPPSPPNYRSSPGPQSDDPGPMGEDQYGPFGVG